MKHLILIFLLLPALVLAQSVPMPVKFNDEEPKPGLTKNEKDQLMFWGIALDIVSHYRARHPSLLECTPNTTYPKIIAQSKYKAHPDAPGGEGFEIVAHYETTTATITYNEAVPWVLLHEFLHHITAGWDYRCMQEWQATLGEGIYQYHLVYIQQMERAEKAEAELKRTKDYAKSLHRKCRTR